MFRKARERAIPWIVNVMEKPPQRCSRRARYNRKKTHAMSGAHSSPQESTMRLRPFALVLLAAAPLLAACESTSSTAAAPEPEGRNLSPVTPATFRLPEGSGCAGEVARFRAVIDNDLATGHTTKPVHERVSAEIASADATCKAGNSGGAIAQIAATKRKFGYR
jgi:hypothetical protein